ncbi:MAG: ATP-binding protein, partial [Bacteroidetes bacterium]|nr:ATP-binding protein [Bacteroidota bacterium]
MTLAESITAYFYRWEQRGRGWSYSDDCVALEPPFAPYDPSYNSLESAIDDGVRPMPVAVLLKKVANLFSPKQQARGPKQETASGTGRFADAPLCFLHVSLPGKLDLDGYEARQLLLMLSYCSHPVSFEVVGTFGNLRVQVTCRQPDLDHVMSQLRTFYPTCTIMPSSDALENADPDQDALVAEFGLGQEFMMPLSFPDAKEPSIYLGIKGIFDTLKHNETACIQVLFQGTRHAWAPSILRSVTEADGSSFFADAPEMPKLAQQKVSSQLYGVVLRTMASSPDRRRTDEIIRQTGNALVGQTRSTTNNLIPLSNEGYDPDLHMNDFLKRRSRRYGMLLNTEELASMVHIPDDPLVVTALSLATNKTKAATSEAQGHAHVLGTNEHMGTVSVVSASPTQRFTHMHVIGATGTGKSTFLLNNIAQDIYNGNGLAVLDPHGDLIESVLECIPSHRMKDVVVIDPSDALYSVGFNILNAANELEKEVLSSDLVSVFQKFSTSWGDQMTSVLANALMAFLESTEGGTLLDLRKFLIEPSFRLSVLSTVTDQSILYYWEKEYPIIKSNSVGSILTRLDSFLRPKAIRYMFAQKKGLDFTDIMDSKRILLVKLSQGLIGESNSYLLGSLLVSKIYQTALGRQAISKDSRTGFFLYIDEFQNFITPSLSRILSGGRKYNLGLIVAHQSLEQISKSDSELASALIDNAGIRVCFRLGETDAQKLEKGFKSFSEEDLLNLPTGEAICRVGRSDMDFNLSVPESIPFPDQ